MDGDHGNKARTHFDHGSDGVPDLGGGRSTNDQGADPTSKRAAVLQPASGHNVPSPASTGGPEVSRQPFSTRLQRNRQHIIFYKFGHGLHLRAAIHGRLSTSKPAIKQLVRPTHQADHEPAGPSTSHFRTDPSQTRQQIGISMRPSPAA
ncbi:hypothetical protein ACLOJK_006644 [Asimina triloba]